jgi:predicted dinucleotide-binding enzyme
MSAIRYPDIHPAHIVGPMSEARENTQMRIAIVGTGALGGAVAHELAGKGHGLILGAGDDTAAKDAVADLIRDPGFGPCDAGGLVQARLLEPFGMVWINQAMPRGKGRDWAFAAVKAPTPSHTGKADP